MRSLEIVRWHDNTVPKGFSKWALRRQDHVHDLTLPQANTLNDLWKQAVPPGTSQIAVVARYPWGCLLVMPAGLTRDVRNKFVDLVENCKETAIPINTL